MKNIYILTVLYEGEASDLINDINDIVIDAYNNKKDAENKMHELINSYLINDEYKLIAEGDNFAILHYNNGTVVKIQILAF